MACGADLCIREKRYLIENIGDPSRSSTTGYFKWLDRQTNLSAFNEPKAFFPALANRLPFWASGPGYRDRPLTFQWRSPLRLVGALGLPAPRSGACEIARCAILADALLGALNGQGVSYSRRKVVYANGKRYRARAHTYATVLRSVDELVQEGWLYGHRVPPNNRGWQSSFCASPELIELAEELGADPTFQVCEPIRLKDDADHLVDYPETRETLQIRRALELINVFLKKLQIELPGAVRQGRYLRVGDSHILPIPGNPLHRIFNRGSFACHGRAYGWWQNIPKTARGDLMIDGEVTAEADYTALHASILYCKQGLKFHGDAYDIGNFPRDHVKLGFNIAVNASSLQGAVCALADDAEISRSDAAAVLAAIKKHHKPISRAFFSDAGVRLMRIDSELILGALTAANDEGFGALPIHDSLIAPARCINLAAEKMVEAFETLLGRANPCQVKIKGIKVPHMGRAATSPDLLPVAHLSTIQTEITSFSPGRAEKRAPVSLRAHRHTQTRV